MPARCPDTRTSALVLTSLLLATPVLGVPYRPDSVDHLGSTPARNAERQSALDEGPAWRAFQARHGAWSALWNEATGSPHIAVGPSFRLEGFRAEPAAVDRAVRLFVARCPELFGDPTLETRSVRLVRGTWYLAYRQTVRGIPVLFEDWQFCVSARGRLMTFRADAHRVPASVVASPALSLEQTRAATRAGLAFDPARDRVEGGERLAILPLERAEETQYRLVAEAQVRIAEPPGLWSALVDVHTGELLWRRDQTHEVITGQVTGLVHPMLATDPLTLRPFAHADVLVGGARATTGGKGRYNAAASGSVQISSALSGPYVQVLKDVGASASFARSGVADGSTVDILWGPSSTPGATVSSDSERDAFYSVNVVHDFVKALDPALTGLDFPVTARVDVASSCGAFTFDNTIYLLGDGSCPSAAKISDVVYHEYGHVVNDVLYESITGEPMMNLALHEATADLLAVFMQDDPGIGKGLLGPGTVFRTTDNQARWPELASLDPHTTGLILGGAFWDLRQSIGLERARELYHFARYGTPDDLEDAGIAFAEYFVQTVLADDDDGDLANGTPHSKEIIAAFNAHGIGTDYFLEILHQPLADRSDSGPFEVEASIRYDPPALGLGSLSLTPPTVFYSIDGRPFATAYMRPRGRHRFTASIPTTPAGVVKYYLQATDTRGGVQVDPPAAPARTHLFLSGAQADVFANDMETDPGWTVGAPTDNATRGVWVRAQPVETQFFGGVVQTGSDHTPDPGTRCFVTGNGPPGPPNDVDGRTTLTTPVFSALGIPNPVIEYYRWFMNAGRGTDEYWRVDLSNDGGAHWSSVESTNLSTAAWERVAVPIVSPVVPTDRMRLRFVAEDVPGLGRNANVECAVDDFRLLSLTGAVPKAGMESAVSDQFWLRPAAANPSRSIVRLSYSISEAGTVALGIYDLAGRLVRSLEQGVREPGIHLVRWDGRDASGSPERSGAYFARLVAGGRVVTEKVVLIR